MSHERATQVSVMRIYLFQGFDRLSRKDVSAANVFGHIAGGGMTSRIHRRLVNEAAVATDASCGLSTGRSSSTFECSASGIVGVTAEALEAAFLSVIAELTNGGVSDDELDEIKSRVMSTSVYRKDNVFNRANTYAGSLAEGMSIADVDAFEADVASLSKADVERAGRAILSRARHVTGILTPRPPSATAVVAGTAQ
jgi:zinc protease